MRGGAALAVLLVAWPAAPPAKADYYRLLDEDRDAAQVRVDLIRGARESIDATYFIVGKDSVALAFLAELRAASLRGVTVRLLIDAPFNKLPLDVRAALRRDGVDIQEYHPFRLTKPWWLGRRLHDKLLIVDDAHLVTGGRNLQASYFGRGTSEPDGGGRNYIDRDAYVRGPAAAVAAAYFDRVWDSREVRRVKLGRFRPKVLEEDCEGRTRCVERQARLAAQIDEASRLLARERDTLEDAGLVDPLEPLVFDARDVGPVDFLHDPVGFRDREDGIGTRLFDLMDETRSSLVLESPWLVPSRALRRSLREAAERGVRVRILTNSFAVTDSILTYAGYLRYRRGLARRGIELWEYAGPGCLHSKTGVLDGATVMIGSFNLDPRSEVFNSEVAIVLREEAAALEARRPMDERLASAVRIGPNGKPVPGPVTLPKQRPLRRLALAAARVVAVFVHRQL